MTEQQDNGMDLRWPAFLRLNIDVIHSTDGKIQATGRVYYFSAKPTREYQLGETWYKLGPEDLNPDGTVNRSKLGIIIQDLIDPFGWSAIDREVTDA